MNLFGLNVLVTGGAGFIGSNLVSKLIDKGARVRTTLYRRQPIEKHPSAEYMLTDLERAEDCAHACQGMDVVVLAAANSSGSAVMAQTPLVHLTPNVIINARMLEAAYAAGVKKVLFISSNTVYPLTDFAVKESDATNEFYETYFIVGWMKRFSEIMCEMYSTRIKMPIQTIVLRPGNIYGPYDKFDWKKSKVIAALIRRVVERQNPIEVWGDGYDIKDFIYIDDFIQGLLMAIEKIDGFDTINIASAKPVTIREILEVILRVDGFNDARVQFDSTKPTMIPKRMIDTSKAIDMLGFHATTSLEDGLRQTIAWYRSQGYQFVED
jgi:GDP-L-fucose synthase